MPQPLQPDRFDLQQDGQKAPAMWLKNPLRGEVIKSKVNIAILRDAFLHNHPSP